MTSRPNIPIKQVNDQLSNIEFNALVDFFQNKLDISSLADAVASTPSVAANTAKVGITPTQVSDIAANTAKIGITTPQADAIVANTAKETIAQSIIRSEADRLRSNHQGTQPASTITGLPTASFNIQDFKEVGGQLRTRAKDSDIQMWQRLGSNLKAKPIGMDVLSMNNDFFLVDNILYLVPVFLNETTTITSVGYVLGLAGVFVANNENRVGIYELINGNLTLVAFSWNDPNGWLFTGARTIALSAPIELAGDKIYWIGALYNHSSQTTAPRITGYEIMLLGSYVNFFMPSGSNLSLSRRIATNTLPVTIPLANTSQSPELPALFLL